VKKLKYVLHVLILLMSLLFTGCGGNTSNGDLSAGMNTQAIADSGKETGGSSEFKSAEQNLDQQANNSQAAQDSQNLQEVSPLQSQPEQPNSVNQESKPTIAVSQINPNSSSTGKSEVLAVPVLTVPSAADSKPSPDPDPNPNPKNMVTLSINCQTAVDKGLHIDEKFQEVVPADGIILAPTVVEFKEGEAVFDVLKQVVRQHKIHMEYEGSKGTPYIQGINNLYEFDGGPLSGWMYCVNKVYPNYGCGEYKLKPGDIIKWNYTCDLGKDLGQTWLGE